MVQVGEGDSLEALAPILRGRPLICFNFADMEVCALIRLICSCFDLKLGAVRCV